MELFRAPRPVCAPVEKRKAGPRNAPPRCMTRDQNGAGPLPVMNMIGLPTLQLEAMKSPLSAVGEPDSCFTRLEHRTQVVVVRALQAAVPAPQARSRVNPGDETGGHGDLRVAGQQDLPGDQP